MDNRNLDLQHTGRVVETDGRFSHVMAISLDPTTNYNEGVIRCITGREGNVEVKGYTDRSVLHLIHKKPDGGFEIGERLKIKKEDEIVQSLLLDGGDFIGLEDADIWIDEDTGLKHLYFTIPIIFPGEHGKNKIYLGHAFGVSLQTLEMTEPTLSPIGGEGAKEASIAPINKNGFRYNLVESSNRFEGMTFSVVKTAIAEDMGKPWIFGKIIFHPAKENISWIGGHASPGPFFPKNFIDLGEGKLLGVMNGREADKKMGEKTFYGIFSVGLFVYDYEKGKIEWISPEPFIRDSEAKTITFASQFVPTGKGKGVLYAHVDDSFVRAYDLNAEGIEKLLATK